MVSLSNHARLAMTRLLTSYESINAESMKILALRPEGLVLPSIHNSLVRAFRSLGVDIFDLRVPQTQEEFESFQLLARRGFQAIFTLDLGRDQTFISRLKEIQKTLKIFWIIWFVDDPDGYGFPTACAPEWTMAFCWDQRICSEPSGNGISLVHLPLAADPEVFSPEETASTPLFPGGVFVGSTSRPNELLEEVARTTPGFSADLEDLWKIYRRDFTRSPQDLAWLHLGEKTGRRLGLKQTESLCRLWVHAAVRMLGERKRQEIVSQVIGPGGGVFGNRKWKEVVAAFYRGKIAYGSELRKVYNQTFFVLDIRPSQARTGLTQRVFDATACGRPVLAESSPELETLFEPGDELLCFNTPEHASEMKELLLADAGQALRRAKNARKRILAHHTYRNRAMKILELLAAG